MLNSHDKKRPELEEKHDELKERAYMKRQGLAKKKLSRLRLIKRLTEKKY